MLVLNQLAKNQKRDSSMKKIKIIFSPYCLKYFSPNHPESPYRIESSFLYLKERGYSFVRPEPATEKDILLVHTKTLLKKIKTNNFFDPDTPNLPRIFRYALFSIGGAIKAAQLSLKEKKTFSLMRPPGHHATKNMPGGFCYFNNIAVAVEKVIKKIKRVAILDIDCHHGQGTEDIFFGRKDVFYFSLHQRSIYPGTGLQTHKNCLNFPLDSGTKPKEYLELFNRGLVKVREFKPKLIAVSAGFDTYKDDPLTSLELDLQTYKIIGEKLNKLNLPLFAVLEGGYSSDLSKCIYYFLEGLR